MNRREFVGIAAIYAAAALLGAIGGITSTESGRKPERKSRDSGGKEPP